jgi:hypothetical protein
MELKEVQNRIYKIRDQKILLDFDLAVLYSVETRALKQAVKRNMDRFPEDFMFQLSKTEWQELITICDNLPEKVKFSPATPFAFTEQGVAMLSSLLKSKKAGLVNIAIMRAFVLMRQYALSHKDLTKKLEEIETKFDKQLKDIYEAISFLSNKDKKQSEQNNRKKIGYKANA